MNWVNRLLGVEIFVLYKCNSKGSGDCFIVTMIIFIEILSDILSV